MRRFANVGSDGRRTALVARIGVVRLLGLTYLRRRPLRSALVILTIAASVAVPGSVAIEIESYRNSVSELTADLGRLTPLRVDSVASHGGLDPEVVEQVAAVPGVASAVPMVQAVTTIDQPAGDGRLVIALGADCRVEAIVGSIGCADNLAAAAHRAPLVSPQLVATLRPGAVLLTGAEDVPLTGAVEMPLLEEVSDGRVAVLPLTRAQELFGRQSTVDAVYIRAEPGAQVRELRSLLEEAVGDRGLVADASSPPPEARQALRGLPPLALVALIAVAVGAVMVFSLMRIVYLDRRRAYATAWALGSRPGLVVAATAVEAAILGVLGGVVGLGISVLLARPLVRSLSEQTQLFTGVTVDQHLGVASVVTVLGLGLAICIAAAVASSWWLARDFLPSLLPGRSAADHQPSGARTRLILGLLCLGIIGLIAAALAGRHGGISRWQQPAGMVGLLAAFIGLIGAAALLVPSLLAWVSRWVVGRPGMVAVALVDAARSSRRTVAIALTSACAVALSVVLAGVNTSVQQGSSTFADAYLGERVLVSRSQPMTPDVSGLVDARYGPDVARELAARPSVAGVDEITVQYLRTSNPANVVVSADSGHVPDFPVVQGELPDDVVARGSAIIGTGLARVRGLRVGSYLSVPTPSGPERLRVDAIWQDNAAVGNSVTVNDADFRRFWGDQAPNFLAVRPAPGVSLERLRDDVVAHLGSDATVLTPVEYGVAVENQLADMLAPFWRMQQMLLLVVALGALVLLLLSAVQRIRQHAILQSLGMRPAQMVALSCVSAAVVGAAGALLGAVAGVVAGQATRWNGVFVVGSIPPFRAPDVSLLVAVALATTAVVIGAVLPAVTTIRTDLAPRLQHE